MPWLFRTPTVLEGPAGFDRLFMRVQLNRGISIKEFPQNVYTAMRFPTQDDQAEAYFFYTGGHEYVVDDAERIALIGGGVGVTADNFTEVTDDGTVVPPDDGGSTGPPGPGGPGTYGDAGYGDGPYGG